MGQEAQDRRPARPGSVAKTQPRASRMDARRSMLHFPKKAMNARTWATWGERRFLGASWHAAYVGGTAFPAVNGVATACSARSCPEALTHPSTCALEFRLLLRIARTELKLPGLVDDWR